MTDPTTCPVHGDVLVPGTAETVDMNRYHSIDFDDSAVLLAEEHFPHARTSLYTLTPASNEVRYCPTCRAAQRAWTRDGLAWTTKHALADAGYDPFKGTPIPRVHATLVSDYVTIEKWMRALHALRTLSVLFPMHKYASLDDAILDVVARARAAGAPLNATREREGRWMTIDEEDFDAALLMMRD